MNKNIGLRLLMLIVMVIGISAVYVYLKRPTNIEKNTEELQQREEAVTSYEQEQKMPPSTTSEHKVDLQIKGEAVYVTYDFGKSWEKVPKSLEKIQFGEYTPSYETGMMDESYYLTKYLCFIIMSM